MFRSYGIRSARKRGRWLSLGRVAYSNENTTCYDEFLAYSNGNTIRYNEFLADAVYRAKSTRHVGIVRRRCTASETNTWKGI